LTIVKPLLISAAAILVTVLAAYQEAFAMHDSNSTINTWITQNGTVAQTIDLNQGPISPVTPGEDTVGDAAPEEEPSVEPPTTTTDEDEEEGEEEGEEETTTDEDEEEGEATETENG
jgi:hypothetical protein